ncbi:MAG: hypothetical protein MUF52_04310 [Syntrophobacteraceae bacterium]|jgi:hypothetical protein|nr:hypothetical protein [Syntrophobacteraceae bacterium]
MSMNFLDEMDEWPEYHTVREVVIQLEKEHLQLCQDLEAIESGPVSEATARELKTRVESIQKRLREVRGKLTEALDLYR